jgi:hypothetical protein
VGSVLGSGGQSKGPGVLGEDEVDRSAKEREDAGAGKVSKGDVDCTQEVGSSTC